MWHHMLSALLLTTYLVIALSDDIDNVNQPTVPDVHNPTQTPLPPVTHPSTGPDVKPSTHVPVPVHKPDTTDTKSGLKDNCTSDVNNTCTTESQNDENYLSKMLGVTVNKDMFARTFYVLISITGIIVIYFVIRTIRTRRRHSRTKRYGLLSNRDDNLEMRPLDSDEDDEDDLTVFDINNRK